MCLDTMSHSGYTGGGKADIVFTFVCHIEKKNSSILFLEATTHPDKISYFFLFLFLPHFPPPLFYHFTQGSKNYFYCVTELITFGLLDAAVWGI